MRLVNLEVNGRFIQVRVTGELVTHSGRLGWGVVLDLYRQATDKNVAWKEKEIDRSVKYDILITSTKGERS